MEKVEDITMENMLARGYVQSIVKEKQAPIRIAFLGGSLTKGEFVEKEQSFVSLFEGKIEEVLGRKVTVLRYGQSGNTSANALYCLPELIADKPDLVFVDFAMNDPGDRYLWESTEGIAYQLLRQGIGVIFLLFCNERGSCTRGAMEKVGWHYQIPVYDIGQYIYAKVQSGELSWQKYAMDFVHPTIWGHQLIAEQLLDLCKRNEGEEPVLRAELPKEPCFTGAFHKTRIWEMNDELQNARAGEVIFDGEVEAKMILVETWQNCNPNEASIVFAIDGERMYCAEAYASMAWGNPFCRYVGGDGTLEKHHLTVTLGKGLPPKGWKYSEFRLRLLIGL